MCLLRALDGRGLHVQQHRLTPRDPFGRDVAAPARSAYLRLADAVDVRVAARARVRAKRENVTKKKNVTARRRLTLFYDLFRTLIHPMTTQDAGAFSAGNTQSSAPASSKTMLQ